MARHPGNRAEEVGERATGIHENRFRNSSLFRQVNERVREVSEGWGDPAQPIGFLCECAADCVEVLGVTIADYDATRATPGRFFIVRGHALPEADAILAEVNGCVVVERDAASS